MNWKTSFRSIYDDGAPEPADLELAPKETAFLVIDVQNTCSARPLSQTKPGWNNLLLPRDEQASQLVLELAPVGDEIVSNKMTDSALSGTNLRLALNKFGSSTARSLADESYNVIVVEDCCAAGSEERSSDELIKEMKLA